MTICIRKKEDLEALQELVVVKVQKRRERLGEKISKKGFH